MSKMLGYLQKVQIAAGGVFLSIFLISVVIQMGCRYAGIAAIWTEDVSMYAFIWAAFMGAGTMVYEKRHFVFTSVSDMLKNDRVKSVISLGIAVVMLTFAVLMIDRRGKINHADITGGHIHSICGAGSTYFLCAWICFLCRDCRASNHPEQCCVYENV